MIELGGQTIRHHAIQRVVPDDLMPNYIDKFSDRSLREVQLLFPTPV